MNSAEAANLNDGLWRKNKMSSTPTVAFELNDLCSISSVRRRGTVLDYMRSVTLDPLLSRSSLIFLSFLTLNPRSRLLQIKFEVKDICITPLIVV